MSLTEALAHIPAPDARPLALRVAPAALRALRRGHPWLFDRGIRRQSREGAPGDVAVIFDEQGRFAAAGLYDPLSPIRVRVMQHGSPASVGPQMFHERLAAAAARRAPLADEGTTGYRLVHGENDGLPGLVIDRYERTLVLKLYTAAWLPHLAALLPGLEAVQPHERLVLRLARSLRAAADPLRDGQVLYGGQPAGPLIFHESGLRFAADVRAGHKTGFFFDHRENRKRVGELATGRSVLDVFAYSGAFSLYAARGGAPAVLSVDSSAPALTAARENFVLNSEHPAVAACRHETLAADAFEALAELQAQGRSFGLVVLDPPSFAKSREQVPAALAAYARLVRLALPLLEADGLFVMASCSSRVTAEQFYEQVLRTAAQEGRTLVELGHSGHALDHPVTFPEGAYLKCLFARLAR